MKKYLIHFISKRFQSIRIAIFSQLSTNKNISGSAKLNQPALFLGKGQIEIGSKVSFGYFPSPFFYSGNIHIESRTKESRIKFGSDIFCNNNLVIVSEKSVIIGNKVLIGTNVEICDSDFHVVESDRWGRKDYNVEEIVIGDNVWIGSNVKILKGVTIGDNSVVSNGAIVSKSIPANSVAGGIPAKVIKEIK